MTERQRIEKILEKHREYFENVEGVDVAFSTKGDFFFYEYNEKYHEYSTFIRFFPAEELELIIEDNIAVISSRLRAMAANLTQFVPATTSPRLLFVIY